MLVEVVRVNEHEGLIYAHILNSTNSGRKRRTGWSKVFTDEPTAGDN